MRVLVIGGSGGMGRFAVMTAAQFESVDSLVIADLNKLSAQAFSDTIGSKATGIGLDVLDREALDAAMKKADLVVNSSGPFFKLGLPVLKAAIKNKCHYLDICDDWEPTLEMLALSEQAKEAGVSATIGLGASPGITNILALKAIQELDSVKTIYTLWNMGGAKPEIETSQQGVNAAMVHGIEQMTGLVRIFEDGTEKSVKPMTKRLVDHPNGQTLNCYLFGHPEAISFPRYFPSLDTSLNLVFGGDSGTWLLHAVRRSVDWGLLSKERAAKFFTWLEARATLESIGADDDPLGLVGMAIGIKDGKPASVAASIVDSQAETVEGQKTLGMGAMTGIPLATGIKLLTEGKISSTGVLAPEGGHIDPDDFLSELFGLLGAYSGQSEKLLFESLSVDMRFIG